ncbi:MAG: tetratricopeptide repeat protein [Verrucomicrobia bacterium]|nr:tetratricopeptide repeat protein [Verrucomicrobiota bacterium]
MKKAVVQLFTIGLLAISAGCTPPGVNAVFEGKKLLDQGETKKAISSLKKATNFLPDSARAYNYLGLAYHRDGQLIAARDAYGKAWSLDNNLAQARFNQGCLMLENRQYALAISHFKTFQMLKPQATEVLPFLALAYYGEGELETAKTVYEDLLRHDSKLPSAWNGIGLILVQQEQYREAYNFFSTALKHQHDYAPALFNQGVISYPSLQRPDLAVKKLREFTFHAPNSPLAPKAKTMADSLEDRLLNTTNQEDATTTNAEVVASNQHVDQSSSQKSNQDTDKPTEQTKPVEHEKLEVAIVQKEEDSNTQTNLTTSANSAPIRLEDDNQKSTVTTPVATTEDIPTENQIKPNTQTEIDTSPSTSKTNVVINRAFITGPGSSTPPIKNTVQPSEPDHTTATSNEVIKPKLIRSTQPGVTPLPQGVPFNPYKYLLPGAPSRGNRNQAFELFDKGNMAFQRNDFREAIDAYEKAVMEDPAYFEAYFNLGLAALKGGDVNKALPAYEYALAIQPNHRDSRYNLSLGLEKLNHYRDAARELEALLKKTSEDTQVLMRLGELYSGPLQRPVRTREIYRELLKVSPGSPESRAALRWLYENP